MSIRTLIRRLKAWSQNDFLANSEAESDRQGYLSYRAEWHSAAWGLSVGILATLTGQLPILAAVVGWLFTRGGDIKVPGYIPYPQQFRRESAYLLGHMVAGIVVGLGLRAVLVLLGVPVPALSVPDALGALPL